MTDKQIIIDAFNSAWNRKVATESSYGKLASKEVFENNNEDKQIIIDDLMRQLNEKSVAIMLLRETLDRKEQECEELKEKLPNAITRLMGELDQLKAENDDLKEKLNQKTSDYDDLDSLGCHGLSDW